MRDLPVFLEMDSSSEYTLTVMLIIVALILLVVLAYTVLVYWIFRGKVTAEGKGY